MSRNNYLISITFFILGIINSFGLININNHMIISWSFCSLFFVIGTCYPNNIKLKINLELLGYACLFCFPFFNFKIFEFIGLNANTIIILTISFIFLANAKNLEKDNN